MVYILVKLPHSSLNIVGLTCGGGGGGYVRVRKGRGYQGLLRAGGDKEGERGCRPSRGRVKGKIRKIHLCHAWTVEILPL